MDIVTDNESFKTTTVKWLVLYAAISRNQAEHLQSLLQSQQIPAFIEKFNSADSVQTRAGQATELFLIHVPEDLAERARATLLRYREFF